MKIIKKIFISLLSIFLIISITISTSAHSNEYQWYIKKRKGDAPCFPTNLDILSKYDVFCIDKKAYDNHEKVIYLTFDAGYENGNVEKILDILKGNEVCAAFFLLDNIILKNRDLVIRMFDEGHTVCNHTKNHKNLSNATKEEIKSDLEALEDICYEQTGKEMSKYFRFPEGKYSISSVEGIKSLGYKTIFWSFAYDDWDNCRQMNNEKALKNILDYTHNGAVILLHPTSKTNAEILPKLIEQWKSDGYRFGALDELTNKG